MKNKKLFLLLALPLVFTSCKNGKEKGKEEKKEELISYHHTEKTFEKTNTKFIDYGTSDYTIVVANNASADDLLAKDELVYFVNMATGIELPVITTNNVTSADFSQKYICLGVNDLSDAAGIQVNDDELLESGYIMKTIENTVFICGSAITNRCGTLYGVYDFLHYMIGYEYYAKECISFNENLDEVYLLNFDEKVIPSFPTRIDNVYSVYRDETNNRRLRFCQESTYWVSFTHTLIGKYITPAKYASSHPEYFGQRTNLTQICWSNQGCFEAVVQEVMADIRQHPNQNIVMLGHGDYWDMCMCEECQEKKVRLDGWGGVELDFTNRVAEACDKLVEKEFPGRTITYVFFAYNPSFMPPLTDEKPYVYKNTGVLLAPIGCDFSKPLDDPFNQQNKAAMNVWADYFGNKNIYVWTYALYCRWYLTPFPNWNYFQDYYRYFESIGAQLLYDQGNYDANVPCFQDMRAYIASKIAWDTNYNYDDLVVDFMDHYYGPVADKMKNLFDLQRAFYQYKFDTAIHLTGAIMNTNVQTNEFWSFEYLNSEIAVLEAALKDLDAIAYLPEYQTYYDRVCHELIGPYYLMLSYYFNQINKDTALRYIDVLLKYMKKYNISVDAEHGGSTIDRVKEWKALLTQ